MVEQIEGQPFPEPDIDHGPEPALEDAERQERASDHDEGKELMGEPGHVPLLDGLVEIALPDIEPDLPAGIGAKHRDNSDHQQRNLPSAWRSCQCPHQRHELRGDAAVRNLAETGLCIRRWCLAAAVHVFLPNGAIGRGSTVARSRLPGQAMSPSGRRRRLERYVLTNRAAVV